MADVLNIPENQDDITAEWVQQALALGAGSDVPPIRGVVIEEIGSGIGMVGRFLRCHLTYADWRDSAPQTVIVIKLPSAGPEYPSDGPAIAVVPAGVRFLPGARSSRPHAVAGVVVRGF